jgi:hypothetical protein
VLAELGAETSVILVGLGVGGPLSVTDSLLDDRVRLGVLLVRWTTEFEGVDPALLMSLFGIVDRGFRVLDDGEECKDKVEGLPARCAFAETGRTTPDEARPNLLKRGVTS